MGDCLAVDAVFRYDFNSPYSYLAAERIGELLPSARWEPIAFAFLLRAQQRVPWSFTAREEGQGEIERRAAERGLPPIRWRDDWPADCYSLDPLRAAWVAADHGLLREFSVAAFRRLFADGEALGGPATIELSEAVGLGPSTLLEQLETTGKERLRAATDEAIREGVPGVPTVTIGGDHYWGDDRLEAAAQALATAEVAH
jgi:2-hydroxychromene-2-carboxylate isomerase